MLDIPYLVKQLYFDIPLYPSVRNLGSLNNNFAPSLYITTHNSEVLLLPFPLHFSFDKSGNQSDRAAAAFREYHPAGGSVLF